MFRQKSVVLYNKKNLGVGASTKKGFHEAFKEGDIDVCIKIDGDGQMDTKNIPKFLNPFEKNKYIYVKGNRFHFHKNFLKMPIIRVFGNFFLSYISKITTGQYNTFDVNNGFIALHKNVYTKINFLNISDNYFFETSMVAEMRKIRCRIVDIKIDTIYDKEISNLKINKILFNFICNHFSIFVNRILNEYIRSKHYLIIYLIIGIFISIIIPVSAIHKITLLITLILIFLYKDKNFVNFKE